MRTDSFLSLNPQGFHRVQYHEWGAQQNQRVLICVHGMVRNSRDFDELALSLSRDYRVVCPDLVGRGQSDWLPSGSSYELNQYLQDMTALIARLQVDQVDWLGTSLGGIIGMLLAACPNSPIRRLILNDIGPQVPQRALRRIAGYVAEPERFDSIEALEARLRQLYSAYEGLSDKQWRQLAIHSARQQDGGWVMHYDPAIGQAAQAAVDADVDLWPIWQQLQCPRLLLWGARSDVLEAQTVARMQSDPLLKYLRFEGIGHAPSLMTSEQISPVMDWLRSTPA